MNNILFYKDNPEGFRRLINPGHFPYLDGLSFELWDRYYQAYFGRDCINQSFAILENEKPAVIVPCQSLQGSLRNNGAPIAVHYAPWAQTRQKVTVIIETLQNLMQTSTINNVLLRTTPINGQLDLLGDRLLKAGATARPIFVSQVDLSQDVTRIRQGIRKSYSPLINWGEKNIKLAILDSQNPDQTLFEQIHQFHIHVAGRVTRSTESWQIQYEMIKAGCAEILIGYLDNQIVSAGLYIDEGLRTTYGVGIYERSLFDKPLAHYITYQGIIRAKTRGQKIFVMGDIPTKSGTEEKLYRIGEFKKGFCPTLTLETQWLLTAGNKENEHE